MRWRDESGVTLVELVVILVIIGLLTISVYSSLGNILQVTESKGAAEQVAAAIRLARQHAITRASNHCIQFIGSPNTAFRIRQAPDNTNCSGTNVDPPAGVTPNFRTIGHGLAVIDPANQTIIFDGMGVVRNFPPANPTVTMRIDTSPHTCENTVLVSIYGGVRVSPGAC